MKQFRLLIFFSTLLIRSFVYGQEYQNITVNEGLPSNNVYRISQDAEGFIWFITDKGMVKYDGAKMKLFSTKEGLPSNDIWNIRVTPDGKVWYFTKATRLGYILNDEVFSFPSENEDEVLIPSTILQAGNEIGFGTFIVHKLSNGAWKETANFHKNKQESKVLLVGEHAKTRFKTEKNNDYVSISDSLGKNSWNASWDDFDNKLRLVHGQIHEDYYSNIFATGAKLFDFKKKRVLELPIQNVFDEVTSNYNRVTNTLGRLQFTNDYGVASLDENLAVTSIYKVPEDINSHFSYIDRDGNIWVASLNNGVYFFPKTSRVKRFFEGQKTKDISKNKEKVFVNVEGIGTYRVNSLDLNTQLIIPTNEYLYEVFSNEETGYNYVTTSSEIYKWKHGQEIKHTVPANPLELNMIARQIVDAGKYGYSNGYLNLNKISLDDFTIQQGVEFSGIAALLDRQSDLLIGSSSGLFSINKDLDLASKKALLESPITCLKLLENQDVIAGSDGYGAYVIRGKTIKKIKGSEDFIVEDIATDKMGSIYLATNKGISVFKKNNNQFELSRKILKSDGLLSNKVNSILISDMYLYTGSDNGLAVIDLNDLNDQKEKPIIYTDHIEIGNEKFRSDTIKKKYSSDNSLVASFGLLDFKDQNTVIRNYQLLPTSSEWNKVETNQINLGNLDPDTYKLTYKIKNHLGVTSSKSVVINIIPLWYQTNWFRFIFFSLLILSIIFFVYWILRRQEKKKTTKLTEEKKIAQIELKALRSQMNPHFVFNSLTAIQYYINNNENEISEKYLVKFSKLIRKFFQLSGEQEIFLFEELELLNGYLEIEKLRFRSKLIYSIEVDPKIDIEHFTIPTMLLQPIIENAVNHGVFNKEDEGKVQVIFKYIDDHEINVIIKDDGVGYKNTLQRSKKKKSSNVFAERLHFLTQSDKWEITHAMEELNPAAAYPGTQISLIIKNLK